MKPRSVYAPVFIGNPMMDMVVSLDTEPGRPPLPPRRPGSGSHVSPGELQAYLDLLRARPELILFEGASGGAFTAASCAAIFCGGVKYIGSAGSAAALFSRAAREAGFLFEDPVASGVSAGRFISFFPEGPSPVANPGAAALLDPSRLPLFRPGELPFFEGFLLSRWNGRVHAESGTCAVDLGSPYSAGRLHDTIELLSEKNHLYLFGNAGEIEIFFQAPLGNPEEPSTGLREAARRFCGRGNTLLLKMGAGGAWMFRQEEGGVRERYYPPAEAQQVHAVNAGDMFAGAFIGAISTGLPPERAASVAAEAGAAAVSVIGNRLTPLQAERLRELISLERRI